MAFNLTNKTTMQQSRESNKNRYYRKKQLELLEILLLKQTLE